MTTWTIVQLERRPSDGFVTSAHWRASLGDVYCYGQCSWSEGQPVIPYDSLTEAQVLEWVWQIEDKDEIESDLAKQIAAKQAKTEAGLPW
jgi:hypothetical protein